METSKEINTASIKSILEKKKQVFEMRWKLPTRKDNVKLHQMNKIKREIPTIYANLSK